MTTPQLLSPLTRHQAVPPWPVRTLGRGGVTLSEDAAMHFALGNCHPARGARTIPA
jgi:hypothetical protein